MIESLRISCFHLSLTIFLLVLLHVSYALVTSDSVYDTFLHCLQKHTNQSDQVSNIIYAQTNSNYSTVLRNYIRNARFNTSSTRKPLLIVTPSLESQVGATVVCSKTIGIQLRIRSGGHDFEGISYISYDAPFIILDMFNFKSITVDTDDESVWVQPGAMLGELYYSIWEKSKVHGFPAGVCSTVGVGGHISGGGYGTMMRKFGLSVDNVLDAKIVDVDGKILDRKSMGEDLFWAIRGGGGSSFGVVLSYKLKLVLVPETVSVFSFETILDRNTTTTDIVYRWQEVASNTDNGLFMRLHLKPVNSMVRKREQTIGASIMALYLGKTEQLVSLLEEEFPELDLKKNDCMEMGWIDSVQWWNGFAVGPSPDVLLNRNLNSAGFLKRKSDYVQKPISKDGLEWIFKKMIESGKTGLVLSPYGGRMSEISASETPFPHRAGNLYKIEYSVNWEEEGEEAEKNYITQIRRLYSYMTPFVSKNPRSAFLNYRDLDIGISSNGENSYEDGKVYGLKYFNDNFYRLVKVKTAVDPHNFFRDEQSIPTLPK